MPTLPRTALVFAEQVQKLLVSMVSKPPTQVPALSMVIQELIACFCTTIRYLTHDFKILIRTLTVCTGEQQWNGVRKPLC